MREIKLKHPLFCYRAWNDYGGWDMAMERKCVGSLSSVAGSYTWQPGINIAECRSLDFMLGTYRRLKHDAPNPRCACGLYGLFSWRKARHRGAILGGVVMWGRMQVHGGGVRAEFAEIIGVVRTHNDHISNYYDVPVVDDPKELEEIAERDWGAKPIPRRIRLTRGADPMNMIMAGAGLTVIGSSITLGLGAPDVGLWFSGAGMGIIGYSITTNLR